MKTFAVMSGNSVINIIVADTKEVAEEVTNATCIEYNETNPASIGWQYNGEKFISPTLEEPTE